MAQETQPSRRTSVLALLRLGVVLPATVWLLAHALAASAQLARPELLAWVAVLLALQLLPPPVWGGPGLSVAFAVQVALAMLYDPPVAGAVAFLGRSTCASSAAGRWRPGRTAASPWSR